MLNLTSSFQNSQLTHSYITNNYNSPNLPKTYNQLISYLNNNFFYKTKNTNFNKKLFINQLILTNSNFNNTTTHIPTIQTTYFLKLITTHFKSTNTIYLKQQLYKSLNL